MPSPVSRGAAMRGSGTAVAVVCFFALLDNALGFCPKGQRFASGGNCKSGSLNQGECIPCGANEYQDDAEGELRSALFLSLSRARARAALLRGAAKPTRHGSTHGRAKLTTLPAALLRSARRRGALPAGSALR